MLGNILPPYHSLQELNLDWILTKVKNILRFVPDDGAVGQILRRTAYGAEWSDEQGAGGSVTSVNGQQGAVVLDAADVGALPDSTVIPDSTSDLINDSGFVNAAGAAAAAPVQSVNGQTGAVSISIPDSTSDLINDSDFVDAAGAAAAAPVQSVNGQTGAVSISIPDSTSDLINDSGFVDATGAAAAAPVQSVNGQTGDVVISEPKYSDATEITGTVAVSSNNATGTWRMDYWGNWAWVYVDMQLTATIAVGGTITGTLTNFPTGYNPMTRGVGWLGATMALFNVGADGSLFVRCTVAQANSGNNISAFMLMSL